MCIRDSVSTSSANIDGSTRRSVSLMSSIHQPSSPSKYWYAAPEAGSRAERVTPKPQPPVLEVTHRRRALRPAKGERSKADRAQTPRPTVPPLVQFGPPLQLSRSPQSLWAGSLPSVSTVQLASVPNTSPMSDHMGNFSHMFSLLVSDWSSPGSNWQTAKTSCTVEL